MESPRREDSNGAIRFPIQALPTILLSRECDNLLNKQHVLYFACCAFLCQNSSKSSKHPSLTNSFTFNLKFTPYPYLSILYSCSQGFIGELYTVGVLSTRRFQRRNPSPDTSSPRGSTAVSVQPYRAIQLWNPLDARIPTVQSVSRYELPPRFYSCFCLE